MLRNTKYIIPLLTGIAIYFSACNASGDFPGREYMPDMAHSKAYEIYVPTRPIIMDGDTVNLFKDGTMARKPVAGTVARGFVPYYYPNTNEGYEQAGKELRNPYSATDTKTLEAGKKAYDTYCAVCHGGKGKADGSLAEKVPPPSYFRDDILMLSEGKMFHSIHHGKNLMGSYASQLTKEERWQVVAYIKSLQAKEISSKKKVSVEKALEMITGQMTFDAAMPAAASKTEVAKKEEVAPADSSAVEK